MWGVKAAALLAGACWLLAAGADVAAQERRFRHSLGASGDPERRMALVIGNREYPQGRLSTPENDARDVAAKLKSLGFEVVLATNLDPTRFRTTIRRFEDSLSSAQHRLVALVYFAGHGVQMHGKNYLLPAQVEYRDQRDVIDFGIDAEQLLSRVSALEPDVTIMILDACRDSPLPPVVRSASRGHGLARMDPPAGTFLAFATSPGSTASDNPAERNGLFTKFLLQHLGVPGLTTEQLFRRVRTDVYRASRGSQLPEDSNRLVGGDFFFAQSPAPPAPVVSTPARAETPAVRESVLPVVSPPLAAPVSASVTATLAPSASPSTDVLALAGMPSIERAAEPPPPAAPPPVRLAAALPSAQAVAKTGAPKLLEAALASDAAIAYEVLDRLTQRKAVVTAQRDEKRPNVLRFSDGMVLADRTLLERSDWCTFDPPVPLLKPPYQAGTEWSYSGSAARDGSYDRGHVSSSFEIQGRERLSTPYGEVEALRVEERRWTGSVNHVFVRWFEAQTRVLIKETSKTPSGAEHRTAAALPGVPLLDSAWTFLRIEDPQ